MDRQAYIAALKDLVSRDPVRVRAANRTLFTAVVNSSAGDREADMVLAEVAND